MKLERLEGRMAADAGYIGPNPYKDGDQTARFHWQDGYVREINSRLDRGESAVGAKE